MKKTMLLTVSLSSLVIVIVYILPRYTRFHLLLLPAKKTNTNQTNQRVAETAAALKKYCASKGYSAQYCFIADLQMHSGYNRFFVYDFKKGSVTLQGMVAHGNCNNLFSGTAAFSNAKDCGCSSFGKYKIGGMYTGRFGYAFKLYGLDSSNSNAFDRYIVLHSYSCVPENECYPQPICNSRGCAMVAPQFLERLKKLIQASDKPIILSIIK